MSRSARYIDINVISSKPPFSNFSFAEQFLSASFAIRRLFSIARSRNYQTLVVENIPAEGTVALENQELLGLFPSYQMTDLFRLSFWKDAFTDFDYLEKIKNESCIGYAILKKDEASF